MLYFEQDARSISTSAKVAASIASEVRHIPSKEMVDDYAKIGALVNDTAAEEFQQRKAKQEAAAGLRVH